MFHMASESWYLWLDYLGPGTYEGDPDHLIQKVLELAKALVDFSKGETVGQWIRSVLTYNEDELDDAFSSVVAKAFRSVMLWLSNHEEFFRLKLRGVDKLEIVPCSRRHVLKYLEMVKSLHLERLDPTTQSEEPNSRSAKVSDQSGWFKRIC